MRRIKVKDSFVKVEYKVTAGNVVLAIGSFRRAPTESAEYRYLFNPSASNGFKGDYEVTVKFNS